jgi:leucyl aminopeptidase (aminopeptidase T)
MGLRRRERVLVVADNASIAVARTLYSQLLALGYDASLITMKPRNMNGEEPTAAVAAAMPRADVALLATSKSLSHTRARQAASAAGTRIASMPGITKQMLERGAMIADYAKVGRITARLARMLRGAERMRITTAKGTDLVASCKGRKLMLDTGIYRKKGEWGNLPAGEVYFAPVEGTAEGVVVIDGALFGRVSKPVKVTIHDGRVASVAGSKKLAEVLRKYENADNVAEIGIGTNYAARIIGNVLENEKVLGTCHVAFGNSTALGGCIYSSVHIDGVIKKPTVEADGKVIMEDGKLL